MKLNKYILLGIAAFGAFACTNEAIEKASKSLSFNVVLENENPVTKSAIDMMSEDGKTCFTLEAEPMTKSVQINHSTTFTEIYDEFEVEGHEGAASEAPVFHGRAVYNSTTGKWDLVGVTPPYIWKPNKQVEIVAAASNVDNTDFFNGISYSGAPSTANFDYALPNNPSTLKDPLYGYFKGAINSDGSASLKFNHPLTSLVFKVGRLPLNAQLQVNSITLSGIDAQAHCVVTFGNASTTYEWTNHAGSVDYTQVVASPSAQATDDIIFGETSAFIVIPRVFPNNSDAKIIINITEDGRQYDIFAPLAGTEWKPGETNIYALSYHGEKKAILASGPDFNKAIRDLAGFTMEDLDGPGDNDPQHSIIPGVQRIVFDYNSPVISGTRVEAPGSSPIFMNYENNTITVSSKDYLIYTGSSCEEMFSGLVNLVDIEGMADISTENATNMRKMFAYCRNMDEFPVDNFDTSKVEDMGYMFKYCTSNDFTSIDLSSFSTEALFDMEGLFSNATHLSSITWGNKFKAEYVAACALVFANTAIVNLDLNSWEPTALGDIEMLVQGCKDLESIDISSFAGANESIYFGMSMLQNCRKLKSINFGSLTLQGMTSSLSRQGMFRNTAQNATADDKCTLTISHAAYRVITQAGNNTDFVASRFNVVYVD